MSNEELHIDGDFTLNIPHFEADFTENEQPKMQADFKIQTGGSTSFANITGDPYDNEALSDALNQKADTSTVETLSETVENNYAELDGKITDESDARTQADADLQSNIDDVADDLSIETDNRQTADADLQDNIDTVDGKIDTHIADKSNPHEVTKAQIGLGNVDNTSDLNKPISTATQTALNGKQNTINDLSEIRTNASNGQSAYNTIQTYGDIVTYDASNFATSIQGQKADTALQPNDNISELNNDVGYITSASLPTVNNSTITFQKNNVTVGDINLNQANNETINFNIPTIASDVNALPDTTTIEDLTTTAQQNAINSGATSINIGQIATNTSNISSLSTTVTNNYNTLDGRITSEVSTLNTTIGTETTNRQNADNNLQSQIDAIVSSSDVFDIVGTYAELQAYDISTVPVNDIIKVLVDSTHSNAATYYRCVEVSNVKSWSYIGSEGAYYTKSESDSLFVEQTTTVNNKPLSTNITLTASDVGALPSSTTIGNGVLTIQNNSVDVDTFNANATSNKTINIVTPTKTSDLTNDSGFIDSSALSGLVTQTDLTNGLATKQDTISDLSTIRSNAANGQSAYTTIGGYGDIVTHNTSEFATSAQGDLADTSIQPNDNITLLNNNAGFITGINSTDVTTALGYIPYDSTNPAGYTSNEGTITDVQMNGTSIVTGSVADITKITPYTSFIVPDTTDMPVIATYEFDIASVDYYKVCSIANNYTRMSDIKGFAIFRMTVTGVDIKQEIEAIIQQRQTNDTPYLFFRNYRGSSDAATTGIRYFRICYPKALNNGYNWDIELAAYNKTERHIKIEIIKTEPQFTWANSLTPSTYNSTYQSTLLLTVYNNEGICGTSTLYFNASSASSAGYIHLCLPKIIAGTQPTTGAALLVNQFAFMNSSKVYPASNKTTAIEPGYGLAINTTAYAANATVSYTALRDKCRVTPLTNIPHATLAKGNPCYFRCTMDSSGNIYSDNYVATSMTAGYTWYYVGIAGGANEICVNTTNSMFLTLDSSGKLTHINGKVLKTDISSSDVITALGYTPYNSTNPNGYTSNVGTVTSVNNTQPDANGDVTLTIPTVNDGILTITQNGTSKGTFSANQSTNNTIALTDTTYNAFTGADGTNAGSSGLVPAPSATDNDKYLKGDGTWASVSGGSSTDVQINGTSITSGGVANIITNTAYDASSNKIATMSDATYTGGTGISIGTGNAINHTNSITAGTIGTSSATSGSTISVPYANYDAQGHITSKGTHTHTVTGFLTSSSTQVASSRFDGQWVGKYLLVSDTKTVGARTHDLSSYLPSDNYKYEVWCMVSMSYNSSASGLTVGTTSNPDGNKTTNGNFYINGYVTTNSRYQYVQGSIPISTDKKMYSQVTGATLAAANIVLCGYRRIGTNT